MGRGRVSLLRKGNSSELLFFMDYIIGVSAKMAKRTEFSEATGENSVHLPYSSTLTADGFAKAICDEETDAILGIHMIGSHAGDILYAGTTLIEMDGTAEDLGKMMAIHRRCRKL